MKTILFILLLLITFTTKAQFEKGDKFFDGSISLSANKLSDPQSQFANVRRGFGIAPAIGFFLNEKVAVGGRLGYSNSYQRNLSSWSINRWYSQSASVGIFIKRYFTLSEKFLFSVQGTCEFSRARDKQSNITETDVFVNKTQSYQIWAGLSPSFIFFPSSNWAFEASIGSLGNSYYRSLSTDGRGNTFVMGYGGFSLGAVYYLRKSQNVD